MSYYSSGNSFQRTTPVVLNLIIINVLVWVAQLSLDDSFGITGKFALYPYKSPLFEPYQLVTHMFTHGGWAHIIFNMFALWSFGTWLERSWGPKKFLIFYLLAGISAGLLHLFVSHLLGSLPAITIGASGSVYGVLIAYALFFPDNLIFLYFLIPVKAKYLIGFLVVIEFLAVDSASSGVAHLAHLGGALFGFLYIMFDKNSYVELKNVFKRSYFYKSTNKSKKNMFDNIAGTFRRNTNVDEANYYDINRKEEGEVTQAEIDEILDKISQSGYQNLTEREKKILFQASKKMK